jgi:ornithine cyclodeaminase
VRIVDEHVLRERVDLDDEVIDTVERAFAALAGGDVVMPPVLRLDLPAHNGEVDVKTAWIPSLASFAIKVSPGFFDNPKLGLPSLNGLMMLFSARTGLLEALLLDNGYLTDVRTAAAGAVAARWLAPAQVHTAAVLGAGVQARLQVRAAHRVRPFRALRVWARDAERARGCASELGEVLGVDARPAVSPAEALADAQLAITATPSREPLVTPECMHPGLHVTAMGSDAEHKNEIHPEVIARADRFVCDRRSQSERLGELHHAVAAGVVAADFPASDLGEVVVGTAPGRPSPEAVTVCDLTGTGVQDTAIAVLAARRAG